MNNLLCKALAAAVLVGAASDAFATACSANANVAAPGTFNGDTCTATDQITNSCGDSTAIGNAKDFIYSVTLGATNSSTMTVNGTGFNPYIALMSGAACNSLDGCSSNNAENAGSAGTNVSIGPSNNAPAGQYWIVITDPGAVACGAFTLTVTPTLPVQLQKFSVE